MAGHKVYDCLDCTRKRRALYEEWYARLQAGEKARSRAEREWRHFQRTLAEPDTPRPMTRRREFAWGLVTAAAVTAVISSAISWHWFLPALVVLPLAAAAGLFVWAMVKSRPLSSFLLVSAGISWLFGNYLVSLLLTAAAIFYDD
jgi:hypothetical protein